MTLRIFDTQSREKVVFTPLDPRHVKLYVCGITSYAPTHVGHGRSAVVFDLVARWLKAHYTLTFVRNYTDIDDKIIRRAQTADEDFRAFSDRYIDQYEADLKELGCIEPDIKPRVTDHIPEIVRMIETLQEKQHAYVVEGDVYFDVRSFDRYGALSGRSLESLSAGARVEVDPRKRCAFDFALWKAAKSGEPSWDSPWGKGRPGWHIECSAMADKYLGRVFDIHGGGKDLIFPHHENEIAQSCACHGTPQLARLWMHHGFVNLSPEACHACGAELTEEVKEGGSCAACGYVFTEEDFKMSKSRGNFYPLREILASFEGEALRLLYLGSHYRSPIGFSHELVAEAERRLDKNYEALQAMDKFVHDQTFVPGQSFAAVFGYDPRERFAGAMNDDFNTPKALAEAVEVFHIANDLIHGTEKERVGRILSPEDTSRLLTEAREILREMGTTLGLWQADPAAYLERRKMASASSLALTPAEIEALIQERQDARKNRDFARADQIRDELKEKGIILRDSKDGTTWRAAD